MPSNRNSKDSCKKEKKPERSVKKRIELQSFRNLLMDSKMMRKSLLKTRKLRFRKPLPSGTKKETLRMKQLMKKTLKSQTRKICLRLKRQP
jgi:hypothetical protein